MSKRFQNALQAQEGASNQRLLARILGEAIEDVSKERGFISDDPAVYLITHQLVWVLYGTDITLKHGSRWGEATQYCVGVTTGQITPPEVKS